MTEKLFNFIGEELNHGDEFDNCRVYLQDVFEGAHTYRLNYMKNHRALYNKILIFCAENNLTVISTYPATLETIIRIEE